ncbi:hypothetical protein FRC12_007094 [Ceratobasidium sp. 428]|nr:hypothetical protein FRC12_007094 [Ceratobasidium sp. 428]
MAASPITESQDQPGQASRATSPENIPPMPDLLLESETAADSHENPGELSFLAPTHDIADTEHRSDPAPTSDDEGITIETQIIDRPTTPALSVVSSRSAPSPRPTTPTRLETPMDIAAPIGHESTPGFQDNALGAATGREYPRPASELISNTVLAPAPIVTPRPTSLIPRVASTSIRRSQFNLELNIASELEPELETRSNLEHIPGPATPEDPGDTAAETFLQSGDIKAADEAIDQYKRILEAPGIAVPPVEQARVASKLSTVLSHRFEQLGDVDDMEEAVDMQIKHFEIAISQPADPILQAESYKGLGKTLTSQFERTGDPADADLAVENLAKALNTVPEDSPARPAILGDIAKAKLARFVHMAIGEDLEQALDSCEQAINALSPEAPERAPLASIYGKALLAKFEDSNNSEDINLAVQNLEYAVSQATVSSPERPKRLRTYGDALLARFRDQKDVTDIQSAINTQQEALNLLPEDSAAVPEVQSSLATAYHTRYRELGRRVEDLDEAIDNYKKAIEETPFSNPEHARVTGMLGKAFMSKYRLEGNFDLLSYAVELHRQALALTPVGNRYRFECLDNLGYAYSKRFRSYALHGMQPDPADKTAAAKAFREALQMIYRNPNHPKFQLLQGEIRRLG